jgi:mono/diheme cytochrome c family protein
MRRLLPLALFALCGCEGVLPAIDWQQMIEQHKYLPYAACDLFSDGRAMRTPPPGTIPHEAVSELPPPRTRDFMLHGRERFDTVCAVCHGVLGDGDAEVARHMDLTHPPTLLGQNVRDASDRKIFEIATVGYGLMPAYENDLSPEERWAVVSWVRVLQLSQEAHLADLPPEKRDPLIKMLDEGAK